MSIVISPEQILAKAAQAPSSSRRRRPHYELDVTPDEMSQLVTHMIRNVESAFVKNYDPQSSEDFQEFQNSHKFKKKKNAYRVCQICKKTIGAFGTNFKSHLRKCCPSVYRELMKQNPLYFGTHEQLKTYDFFRDFPKNFKLPPNYVVPEDSASEEEEEEDSNNESGDEDDKKQRNKSSSRARQTISNTVSSVWNSTHYLQHLITEMGQSHAPPQPMHWSSDRLVASAWEKQLVDAALARYQFRVECFNDIFRNEIAADYNVDEKEMEQDVQLLQSSAEITKQETNAILQQKEKLVQESKQRMDRFAKFLSALDHATTKQQVSNLKRSYAEMIAQQQDETEPAKKKQRQELTYHPL